MPKFIIIICLLFLRFTFETPFTEAVENDNLFEVQKILNEDPSIVDQFRDEFQRSTALMEASYNNQIEMVKILIAAKAQVNLQDELGFSALMLASYRNRPEIVQILINARALIDQTENNGTTALMMASGFTHTEVVRMLLRNRAKVDLKNVDGMTALNFSVFPSDKPVTDSNSETVELLVFHGADVSNVSEKKLVKMAISKKSEIFNFFDFLDFASNLPGNLVPFDVVNQIVRADFVKNLYFKPTVKP